MVYNLNQGLIVTGTRPQIIKTAPLIEAYDNLNQKPILVHTGQHYDFKMDKIQFIDLQMPEPDFHLKVGGLDVPNQMTEIILKLNKIIDETSPDYLVTIGDTTSALSAALVGFKKDIPVAHIEAGVRNYDYHYQEELNRNLIDSGSTYLFAPTKTAEENLKQENIMGKILTVGDTMLDVFLKIKTRFSESESEVVDKYTQDNDSFILCTIHRREIVDNPAILGNVLKQINCLERSVILPIHPRTKKRIEDSDIKISVFNNINFIEPLAYSEFHSLLSNASLMITDSGGIQKEAFFWNIPAITLRDTITNWPETLVNNANIIVNPLSDDLFETAKSQMNRKLSNDLSVFGNGKASEAVAKFLLDEKIKLPKRFK